MLRKTKMAFWNYLRSMIYARPNILYPLAFQKMLTDSNLSPKSIDIEIRQNLLLGKKGEILSLPFDSSTLTTVFSSYDWHEDIISHLQRELDKTFEYEVFDIGANVGIFSRSVLNSGLLVGSLCCIEPDKNNFNFLKKNLQDYETESLNIRYENVALSDFSGKQNFYRDLRNSGNYSLNKQAVSDSAYDEITVDVEDAGSFFEKETSNYRKIIKMDTQGHDEKILTLIPKNVIDSANALILEVWAIPEKQYNRKQFLEILSGFDKIYFGNKYIADVNDVLEFSCSETRQFKDLVCFKI